MNNLNRKITACCPICSEIREFEIPLDKWKQRDFSSSECTFGNCVSRDREIAKVISSFWTEEELSKISIHEAAPSKRGISKWLSQNVLDYVPTGYFPSAPFGDKVGEILNEDLEKQSFGDARFDLVIHLDVLEHVFSPFDALREIFRTLKPGGYTIFTIPTEPSRYKSEQVAFKEPFGSNLRLIGEPEYHGNPQRPEEMALVTWRYGYDFPFLIRENTGFDVEVRRYESDECAVIGFMTEVYICKR